MSFTYDANGNMLTKADTGASSNSTYTYDYENRLVRADRNASGNTTTSYYYYDPFGRRIMKLVYENGTSTLSRVAWYVYDREDILVESRYDSRPGYSTGLFLNIHGPNIDEPVAYTNNGQLYFYHADGLGSVRMITEGTGNVTRRYSYDAYGNIIASIIDRPYTYTGREYDDETGLYYYRARYYDPKIGRFISKDPIGFNGGDMNLYSYVGNNPVNWVDPWGLQPGLPPGPMIDPGPINYNPNLPPADISLPSPTGDPVGDSIVYGIIWGTTRGAIAGAIAGSVILPEIGAVPGAIVGGFAGGVYGFGGGFISGASKGLITEAIKQCR